MRAGGGAAFLVLAVFAAFETTIEGKNYVKKIEAKKLRAPPFVPKEGKAG